MITPLYRRLKDRGTTLYVFPGANEDVNAQKQNDMYSVVFSKFALLNIPRKDLRPGVMDPESAFVQSGSSVPPSTHAEALVESLRNYVANHEASIRNSKTGTTTYFYDPSELSTVTERIFWKWMKSLDAIGFEVADTTEEWPATDPDFDDLGTPGNTDHFREYLWRERATTEYNILSAVESPAGTVTVVFDRSTNFRPGDVVLFTNLTGVTSDTVETVVTTTDDNDTITFLGNYSGGSPVDATGQLDYQQVVNYVGEVPSSNNVVKADVSYTEVFAFVPPHAGRTPTILFKTSADANYRPGQTYPTLASQYQPEVNGAEDPLSPLLTDPGTYPGDYFGHFDASGYKYTTQTGDSTRRSGDYFGVTVSSNIGVTTAYPDLDGSTLDGVGLDFDITHYTKASSTVPVCTNFDEFSSASLGNEAPDDFEFNAVLWYYDATDSTSGTAVTTTNLYGIMFLDSPVNDDEHSGEAIPALTKYVTNGEQEGTSYTFAMNLFTQTESEVGVQAFDPDRAKTLVEFDLFNEALNRLATLNDQFLVAVSQVNTVAQEVAGLRGLIYTLPALDGLFLRMDSIEANIIAYKTLQLGSSDTVEAYLDSTVSPPLVKLNAVDRRFSAINIVKATELYSTSGDPLVTVTSTPKVVAVSSAKDFLVLVENDDPGLSSGSYDPSNEVPNLEVRLEKDLEFRQTVEYVVYSAATGKEDKGIYLSMNYSDGTTETTITLGDVLSLPLGENSGSTDAEPYFAYKHRGRSFAPKAYYYSKQGSSRYLTLDFDADLTSIASGSRVRLDDATVNSEPDETAAPYMDISGTYAAAQDAAYIESPVTNASILQPGAGYGVTGTRTVNVSPYSDSADFVTESACVLGVTFTAGVVTAVKVLRGGFGFKPDTNAMYTTDGGSVSTSVGSSLIVELDPADFSDDLPSPVTSPSTVATIRLDVQARTRVKLDVTDNEVFTDSYDAAFSSGAYLPAADNTLYQINKDVRSAPAMRFNHGYRISLTRINEQTNTPASEWYKRYRMDINEL